MNSSQQNLATRSAFLKEMGITEWEDRSATQTPPEPSFQGGASEAVQASAKLAPNTPTSLQWVFIGTKLQGDALTLFQNMIRVLGLGPGTWVWNDAKASLDEIPRAGETPLVSMAFGAAAAQRLTGENAPLAELRGAIHALQHQDNEIPLIATFELAQVLARPTDKALLWEDLLLARSVLQNL